MHHQFALHPTLTLCSTFSDVQVLLLGPAAPVSGVHFSVVTRFVWSFQSYVQLYDLSRSERLKVHDLAVAMATDGQPLGRIRELVGVAVGPLDLSVKTVFGDAVEKVVAALRYQPVI